MTEQDREKAYQEILRGFIAGAERAGSDMPVEYWQKRARQIVERDSDDYIAFFIEGLQSLANKPDDVFDEIVANTNRILESPQRRKRAPGYGRDHSGARQQRAGLER
jgi:hypothetical protein